MASGGQNGTSGVISGINVTPLVDITLVLLIIFMVTAKLVVAPASALGVKLPKATGGEAVQVIFSLQLTKEGATYVNGHIVTDDDAFLQRAEEERAQHPDLRVVIQADGAVPHWRVIHVMDLLSRTHITNIAFAVDSSNSPPTGTGAR